MDQGPIARDRETVTGAGSLRFGFYYRLARESKEKDTISIRATPSCRPDDRFSSRDDDDDDDDDDVSFERSRNERWSAANVAGAKLFLTRALTSPHGVSCVSDYH